LIKHIENIEEFINYNLKLGYLNENMTIKDLLVFTKNIKEQYIPMVEQIKNISIEKCEYCNNIENDFKAFSGCEGIALDLTSGKHNIVIEHYNNEINKTEINYCPWCGRKL
jgi:hypothetical protein